ncbi:MAG: hypothetical protein EOQ44_25165 [Mesorhizobium sp.]|uniref:hypothetical protein n=1 Tax=Mesorhizobium sp. TaxID=1871066 RepID=UPI000FE998C0|nr:hypothetical protein [Mesorhizobium sp.]RWB40436.1 MAG: hypothetical protein EOQ44_25165 [Mesorhizobium sp.]
MGYSCTDFTDSILEALGIQVPDKFYDDTAEQAEAAIQEIEALQQCRAMLVALRFQPAVSKHEWPVEDEEEEDEDDDGE